MSLQPNAIELCQTSALRGRRRSSRVRPQNLLPLLFTTGGPPPNQDESAVADELCLPDNIPTDAALTLVSPISDAHVSGHSSSFSTSRHHDTFSTHKSVEIASPSDSAVSGGSFFESANPPKNSRLKWRLASALFLYFLNGWGDGVTGTALPYFRSQFHLSYMTSSLLFVGTMCGFTLGTLSVSHILNFLGRFYLSDPKLALFPISPFRIAFSRPAPGTVGHSASQAQYLVILLATFGSPIAFVLMGSKIGLSAMFLAYVVISFCRAVLTAPLNVFLAKMPSRPLGYAYASWGLGAVVSPLVFQVTAAAGLPWAHFYFGSLVLTAANIVFLGITFTPTPREFAMDRKCALDERDARFNPPLGSDSDRLSDSDISSEISSHPQSAPTGQLRLAFSMRYQWAVSLLAVLYCGSETTTQGLIVQYLLAERSANPNTVGYVTAGFWTGITVSRTVWSYFSPRISFTTRKFIVQGCLGMGLAMQLLIWFIDSNIENAVSCSLIGLFFGPLWPAILELTNDLLPVEVSLISMAIVSAAGSLGSAILPFITGVVVTKYSMRCWPYITVSQVAIVFGTWYMFPTRQPPRRSIAV